MPDALKVVAAPGSLGFLAAGCGAGLFVIYVWPRHRRAGRLWLIALYSAYVVFGVPVLGHAIASRLTTFRPLDDLTPLAGLETLIVLGGDNAVGRVAETVRIARAAAPRTIVVSGEDWLIDRLIEAGVRRDAIVHDARSTNTREQMMHVAEILREQSGPAVLVASRLQMPRVAALARALGLQAVLAPSPLDIEPPAAGPRAFLPTYAGLRLTRDALYEHAALAYYRWQRWLPPSDGPGRADGSWSRAGTR